MNTRATFVIDAGDARQTHVITHRFNGTPQERVRWAAQLLACRLARRELEVGDVEWRGHGFGVHLRGPHGRSEQWLATLGGGRAARRRSRPAAPRVPERPVRGARSASGRLVRGSLDAMPLAEILQNIEHNEKSGSLTLDGAGLRGVVLFAAGRPVSARTSEGSTGADAILRLLDLTAGEFVLSTRAPRERQRRINSSFTGLLLDYSRRCDELHQGALQPCRLTRPHGRPLRR